MIKAILFFLIAVFFALLTSIFILKKSTVTNLKKYAKLIAINTKNFLWASAFFITQAHLHLVPDTL